MKQNKGLVVVICAPSQGGKDFIAQSLISNLTKVQNIEAFYATTYKTRKARAEEAEYIHCVKSEIDIPIEKENQISVTIYDTQKVVYDKKEIFKAIDDGKIIIIATGSPEAAVKVKNEFGENCISIFVKRQQVDEKTMLIEDFERHGIAFDEATEEQMQESYLRVRKRIEHYEKMKPQFFELIANEKSGADYIFRNWFTLIGGSWDSRLEEMAKNEFYSLYNFVSDIYNYVNNKKSAKSWRLQKNLLFQKVKDRYNQYLSKKTGLNILQKNMNDFEKFSHYI